MNPQTIKSFEYWKERVQTTKLGQSKNSFLISKVKSSVHMQHQTLRGYDDDEANDLVRRLRHTLYQF